MSRFSGIVEMMPKYLETLLSMQPTKSSQLTSDARTKGIYLFLEHDRPLYLGRSNNMYERIAQHRRPSSPTNQAAFAVLIARQKTGRKATYKPEGSRKALVDDPVFNEAFQRAKRRIAEMDVQFVEITDAMSQAVFEIFASDALRTPFNSWENH
jgi:hypothetical protein